MVINYKWWSLVKNYYEYFVKRVNGNGVKNQTSCKIFTTTSSLKIRKFMNPINDNGGGRDFQGDFFFCQFFDIKI